LPDLVLYQPDIPGNTGALLRLAACTGTTLHLIEPAGFRLDDKSMKRAGMDYLEIARLARHLDWDAFETWRAVTRRRLVLMTTAGAKTFTGFAFRHDDLLMLGRESAGVPQAVHDRADARLLIPMAAGARSLNVAMAGAITLSEALRQTGGFEPFSRP